MIFYLHYILLTSGLCGTSVLLGVYLRTYSDASQAEIGALLMSFPFIGMILKPLFCSLADRSQTHKNYLVLSLAMTMLGHLPYLVIPFLPDFYSNHPRLSWYALVLSGQVGCSGLCVAWSMGEALAVNASHRRGTPYARMRLMGTVSWGIMGYLIGLVNESPLFPKYIPAFLTMEVSILVEIILVLLWNDDDFRMGDAQDSSKPVELKLEAVEVKAKGDQDVTVDTKREDKQQPNLQKTLLLMILRSDGRLAKYLLLFTLVGFILSPMGFLFISISELCREQGCDFSFLGGSILLSQATIETVCFLVLPWFLKRVSRVTALTFALSILVAKYFFYSTIYYSGLVSPYWAIIGEWGHGIAYGIFCTLTAEVALMFSNEGRLFVPELKQMGLVSSSDKQQAELDEQRINFALRATMQGLFASFNEGLGQGVGTFLCGLLAEHLSYIALWYVMLGVTSATLAAFALNELARSSWSDTYRPSANSKAAQLMAASHGGRQPGAKAAASCA